MATRTSMPSPCRRRVADPSAASSASKMISLSTPFSLDTASTTIRISLFIVRTPAPPAVIVARNGHDQNPISHSARSRSDRSEVRRKPRLVNAIDGQAHRPAIDLKNQIVLAHLLQAPGEPLAAIHGSLHLDPHLLAGEAREVRMGPQHPVQAGRGHLQGVLTGNRIRRVQRFANLTADAFAILKRDRHRRIATI